MRVGSRRALTGSAFVSGYVVLTVSVLALVVITVSALPSHPTPAGGRRAMSKVSPPSRLHSNDDDRGGRFRLRRLRNRGRPIIQASSPRMSMAGRPSSSIHPDSPAPPKAPVIDLKGDNVIVTNVRAESEYIIEWLNYHLWIGFDTILIFCQDDNPDLLRNQLAPYLERGVVVIIPWKKGKQLESFWHFLGNYQTAGQIVMFTDIDEFLVLCKHATVSDMVQDLYPGEGRCLQFYYLFFGTSFLPMHQTGSSVISRFHLREKNMTAAMSKVAIKSTLERKRYVVHHRCDAYHLNKTKYPPDGIDHVPPSVARLNHYYFRAGLETYKIRLARNGNAVRNNEASNTKRYKETDVRTKSRGKNSVSDPTLLSIEQDFPGLLIPEPPLTRRKATADLLAGGSFCKEPLDPYPPTESG